MDLKELGDACSVRVEQAAVVRWVHHPVGFGGTVLWMS
jgi:hypothetical protein